MKRTTKPIVITFSCPHCNTYLARIDIKVCPTCEWPVSFPKTEYSHDKFKGDEARFLYEQFKVETPTHKTMRAAEFWQVYITWLEIKLLGGILIK